MIVLLNQNGKENGKVYKIKSKWVKSERVNRNVNNFAPSILFNNKKIIYFLKI